MAGNPFDNKKASGTVTKARGGLAVANGEGDPVSVSRSSDPFALPTSGGGDYKFTEFLGELLLVRPVEAGVMPTTISAESEYVRVDVVRLDNDNEQVSDLLVFAQALLRTLKGVMRGDNEWMCARLSQGTAKPGKNAPYIFQVPDKAELDHARSVMNDLGL